MGLVRGRRGPEGGEGFSLGQYVNDRPYAASSLLAVAMSRVYKTAMSGRCEARPELAASPIPLELRIPVLPCRGGAGLARRLFEPLGWEADRHPDRAGRGVSRLGRLAVPGPPAVRLGSGWPTP